MAVRSPAIRVAQTARPGADGAGGLRVGIVEGVEPVGDLVVVETAFEERPHQSVKPVVCERVLVLDAVRVHEVTTSVDVVEQGVDLLGRACDGGLLGVGWMVFSGQPAWPARRPGCRRAGSALRQ